MIYISISKRALRLLSFSLLLLLFKTSYSQDTPDKDYKLYLFLLDNCKICESYTLKINEFYKEYNDMVEFIAVFPNLVSTEEKIESYMERYKIQFPYITDYDKEIAKSLNATITPEVFLVENETGEVLYSGRIDDEFFQIGKRRNVVKNNELSDALQNLREGNSINVKTTEAVGCFINFFDNLE